MGIFEIKIYVNVYRFLRKYSAFYISTVRFSLFSFLLLREQKKCNIRHPSE